MHTFLIGLGCVVALFGFLWWIRNLRILAISTVVHGSVTRIVENMHAVDKEPYFHSEIAYCINHTTYTFIAPVGSDPSDFQVGDVVRVMVETRDPANAIAYDPWFRFMPCFVMTMGGFMIGIGFMTSST